MKYLKIYILINLICLSFLLSATEKITKSKKWLTLTIDNITINYQENFKDQAYKIIALYLSIAPEYKKKFKWEVKKLQIVLGDDNDFSNGYSTPYTYNLNYLYALPSYEGQLLDNSGWFEILTRHEGTHLYQMDKATDSPFIMRQIFGRFILFFPNIFFPNWITEGLAVFEETNQQKGFGRGANGIFDSYMRLEYQKGFKSLTELSFNIRENFPRGSAYYYGYYFMEFLDKNYGFKAIQDLLNSFSDNLIPYRLEGSTQEVFGRDMSSLWKDYQQYLKTKFGEQRKIILQKPNNQSQFVGKAGFTRSYPQFGGKNQLFFYQKDGYSIGKIVKYNLANKQYKTVLKNNNIVNFSVNQDGDLLYSKIENCKVGIGNKKFLSIYLKKHNSLFSNKLISCIRFHKFTWFHNKDYFIASQFKNGIFKIIEFDIKKRKITNIFYKSKPLNSMGSITISPDNKNIIFAERLQYKGWKLIQLNLTNLKTKILVDNKNINFDVNYINNNEIIYVANKNRIFNIFNLNLKTNKIKQLTNTISANYSPTASLIDGNLIYAFDNLTRKGHQVKVMKNPRSLADSNNKIENYQYKSFLNQEIYQNIVEGKIGKKSNYYAINTMIPQYWFPVFKTSNDHEYNYYGFSTSVNDALSTNSLVISPLYYIKPKIGNKKLNNKLGGSVIYSSYLLGNQFAISYIKDFSTIADDIVKEEKVRAIKENNQIAGTINIELVGRLSKFNLTGGYSQDKTITKNATLDYIISDIDDQIYSYGITYNSLESYYKNFNIMSGRKISYQHQQHIENKNSIYKNGADIFSWQEYLPLTFIYNKLGSLSLGYSYGYANKKAKFFEFGGTDSNQQILHSREYGFLGYDKGLFELIGNKFNLYSINWNFTLGKINDGITVPPLGIGGITTRIFSNSLNVINETEINNKGKKLNTTKRNIGIAFNIDVQFGYSVPINMEINYAKGLDKDGDNKYLISLGLPKI